MSKEVQKSKVIAIDGPCGSGKSTIAKLFAHRIGALYIDTGAMFRAIALSVRNANIDFSNSPEMDTFIGNLDLVYGKSEQELVLINQVNLTQEIRNHEVSELASQISQISVIRGFLVKFQRDLVKRNVCVMEGRDIGTIVFPDSFCKFYLTASIEERATRRLLQLEENGDKQIELFQVIEDVKKRDYLDMTREVAPLKQANDAILIDSTFLSTEEVMQLMNKLTLEKATAYEISL